MTRALRLRTLVAAVAVALPTIASAQTAPVPVPSNWFAGGFGAYSFGTSPDWAYGLQGGARVMTTIDVLVEIGYLHDVLPTSIRDDFGATLQALSTSTGEPVTGSLRLPAIYGLGGLRWVPRSSRRARPFVEAGAGFAHLAVSVDRAVAGGVDVTSEVRRAIGGETAEVRFLASVGGGVTIALAHRRALDVGYRFHRVSATDPAINTSVFYAAFTLGS